MKLEIEVDDSWRDMIESDISMARYFFLASGSNTAWGEMRGDYLVQSITIKEE